MVLHKKKKKKSHHQRLHAAKRKKEANKKNKDFHGKFSQKHIRIQTQNKSNRVNTINSNK